MCLNIYDKHDRAAFAREALFVQDAGNLRAIARLLVAAADYAADRGGTQASWNDPAVILIVDKLMSLTPLRGDARAYSRAYSACEKLATESNNV